MEETAKKKNKVLFIRMPEEVHELIKIKAEKENITMKLWVLRSIYETVIRDEDHE